MKRVTGAIALIAALYTMRCGVLPRVLPPGDIEYRGEKIRLAKWYYEYEDYEEDTDQIAPEELPRVEALIIGARLDRQFASRLEMAKATSAIRFPGYGSSQFGDVTQPDGTVLSGHSVEIPPGRKDRVFVFRGRNGAYTLVDDFVAMAEPPIMRVRQEANSLVYSTREGALVLTRPVGAY